MTNELLTLLEKSLTMNWLARAACTAPHLDPDDWFPEMTSHERGTISTMGGFTATERRAKSICVRCPVRQPCLVEGLSHGIQDGIWAGTTERERNAFAKARLGMQDILDKMDAQASVYGLRKEAP